MATPFGHPPSAVSAANSTLSDLKDDRPRLPPSPAPLGFEDVPSGQTLYTTAGTVWRPESEKPLKAPLRRGRANRYSPVEGGNYAAFLTRQVNAVGIDRIIHPSCPYSIDRVQTPTYSPLQQNNERARVPFEKGYLQESTLPVGRVSRGFTLSAMRSTAELAGLTMSPSAVSHAVNQIHAGEFGEGDSATPIDYGDESIRGLPVKSLANLASYPNPHQELARNALEKSSFAMGKSIMIRREGYTSM